MRKTRDNMIKGLTHVAILVTDIERSIDFYVNVLGLTEQFRLCNEQGKPHLVYIRIADGQFIELFGGATGQHKPSPTAGPVHLCLEVDDIQQAYVTVTSRGGKSLHGKPTFEADYAWQFWTEDPDENPIEFHQFTDESLQKQPTQHP